MLVMSFIADLSDQTIDSWLRRHQPRTELAMRYSMRIQFDTAKDSAPFNARIDELFAVLHPSEEEYAEILRRARALGSALGKILNGQRDHQPQ
jgi:hypothetical protein